jgi:hypothetical protein
MRLYRNRQGLTKGKNKTAKRLMATQKRAASKEARKTVEKKERAKANAKKNRQGSKTPHKTRPELLAEMITRVAAWFPDRKFVLVVDSLYSGKSVLSKLPGNFDLIGPVHPQAALYHPAPEETGTRRGPRRKKGERLPDAKSWEEDSSHWSTHHFDQYGLHGSLQTKTNTGLYYKAGNDRLLRLVLSRDTVGDRPTRIFYSTNVDLKAREILSLFSLRWSIEVTHFDCKQHLGLEDAANRKEEAVKRTARMAMFLHSLTVVWYATDGHRDFQIPVRPWYWWKTEPSFADMLTTLRRKSREEKLSTVSLDTTQRQDNLSLLTYLATLAG